MITGSIASTCMQNTWINNISRRGLRDSRWVRPGPDYWPRLSQFEYRASGRRLVPHETDATAKTKLRVAAGAHLRVVHGVTTLRAHAPLAQLARATDS